ncbi:MAG: PAS domain-containing protein [Candidatus Lokiarchaeota archaeon]|nr:PAS domain-containing protein [Candidatus Lokiarchaeota archaeon]MBD3343164.1 PAS domain-containing protein [Candidatus Lokiarchaeota archaeon]
MSKKEFDTNITEEFFQDLEHGLKEVINFLPDATFIINTKGQVIAWNKSMEELTNIKQENIIGKDNYAYSVPFYNERRPILIDLALEKQKKYEEKYLQFERINGTLTSEVFVPHLGERGAFLWAKARPLYDSEGKITGAIETIRDITNIKLAEKKLRNSKADLKEKVNELSCLHKIIKFIKNPNIPIDDIFLGTLDHIKAGWDGPHPLSAKITFNGTEYKSEDFKETPYHTRHIISINDKEMVFDIYYSEETEYIDDQKKFIKQIADEIKAVIEFKLDWLG